jgi:hypothetical protein
MAQTRPRFLCSGSDGRGRATSFEWGRIDLAPSGDGRTRSVVGSDFVMRTSLRDRCTVGFWLVLMGLAAAGWWAGLTWAALWLTIRTLS